MPMIKKNRRTPLKIARRIYDQLQTGKLKLAKNKAIIDLTLNRLDSIGAELAQMKGKKGSEKNTIIKFQPSKS